MSREVTLPSGWILSDEALTVVIDYDDPKWTHMPEGDGCDVDSDITGADIPFRLFAGGKWQLTFRWLRHDDGPFTIVEVSEVIWKNYGRGIRAPLWSEAGGFLDNCKVGETMVALLNAGSRIVKVYDNSSVVPKRRIFKLALEGDVFLGDVRIPVVVGEEEVEG